MFQIVSQAELDALADGIGIEGSLGVVYQLRDTGKCYEWNPATRVMDFVGGLTAAQVAAVGPVVLVSGLSAAASNASAINARLTERGHVVIVASGLAYVSGTLVVRDNTTIEVAANTELCAITGRAQPLLINEHAGVLQTASLMVRSSGIVSVTETNSWRTVGQQLFISGGGDATFRGVVTILSVTTAGYSYASAGSDGAAGAATVYYNVIPVRRQLAASAFLALGDGYVDVTDPEHGLRVGDMVFLGNVAASVFAPGVVKVTRVDSTRWTYFASGAVGGASGTFVVSYDTNISIVGGGEINGNRPGCVVDVGSAMRSVTSYFGCVTDLTIDCAIGGSPLRAANAMNCASTYLGRSSSFRDCLVGFQAEGGCDGIVIDQARSGSSALDSNYFSPVAMSSASVSGANAIINTVTAHGLETGSMVTVTGMTPATYNATSKRVTVVTTTQFYYTPTVTPGGAATVLGSYTVGQQSDDYVAFTGTAYAAAAAGNYDDTISPYGLTYFAGIDVRSLHIGNALNAVKITAMSTCPFIGTTRIGRIYAHVQDAHLQLGPVACVRIMDDGPGLVATTVARLQLDGPIEFIGKSTRTAASSAVSLTGTGSIANIAIRNVHSQLGADAVVIIGGMTVGRIDIETGVYPVLGANKPAIQQSGGTLRNLVVRNSTVTVGTAQPFIYLFGGTVNNITLDNIQVSGEAAGVGSLIEYAVGATGLANVRFTGIRTVSGANAFGTLMQVGNVAAGALSIAMSDIDVTSATLLTTPGSGGSGTFRISLGAAVKWTATGGNNAIQFGFGTLHITGPTDVSLPTDKLVLFGFGAPTYRIDMPSSTAGANFNAGNYVGAQIVPLDGDMVYNTNAGVLAVGKLVRRAGVWTAL